MLRAGPSCACRRRAVPYSEAHPWTPHSRITITTTRPSASTLTGIDVLYLPDQPPFATCQRSSICFFRGSSQTSAEHSSSLPVTTSMGDKPAQELNHSPYEGLIRAQAADNADSPKVRPPATLDCIRWSQQSRIKPTALGIVNYRRPASVQISLQRPGTSHVPGGVRES